MQSAPTRLAMPSQTSLSQSKIMSSMLQVCFPKIPKSFLTLSWLRCKGSDAPLDKFKTFFKSLNQLENQQEVLFTQNGNTLSVRGTLAASQCRGNLTQSLTYSRFCQNCFTHEQQNMESPICMNLFSFFVLCPPRIDLTFGHGAKPRQVKAPNNKSSDFASAALCKAMFDIYLVSPALCFHHVLTIVIDIHFASV
jgi:hypothetical protein